MNRLKGLASTRAPASVEIIRVMVGLVFLTEGVQKYPYPDELGVGRFLKIGIPAPEVMGPLVGTRNQIRNRSISPTRRRRGW
jgi:putative oxidoreductase